MYRDNGYVASITQQQLQTTFSGQNTTGYKLQFGLRTNVRTDKFIYIFCFNFSVQATLFDEVHVNIL
jgi:hypothetical protein